MSNKFYFFGFIAIGFWFLCMTEESISTDTIRNCMKMLEKSGYIEITNGNGTRAVALQKNYDSIKDVRNITQRIESIVTALD